MCPLAGTVASVGGLLHLLQKLAIAFEDSQRFREIRQLEVNCLNLRQDRPANGLDQLLGPIGFARGDLAAQPQLSGVGDILRKAQPDVREVAVRVSRKRPRAANAELLNLELWIGQCRDLRGNLPGCFPALPRGLDLWIILLCLLQQVHQGCHSVIVLNGGILCKGAPRESRQEQQSAQNSCRLVTESAEVRVSFHEQRHFLLLSVRIDQNPISVSGCGLATECAGELRGGRDGKRDTRAATHGREPDQIRREE